MRSRGQEVLLVGDTQAFPLVTKTTPSLPKLHQGQQEPNELVLICICFPLYLAVCPQRLALTHPEVIPGVNSKPQARMWLMTPA